MKNRKEDRELRKRVLFLSILLLCAGLVMENHQTDSSQDCRKIVSTKTSGIYTLAYGDNQTFEHPDIDSDWVIEWSFSTFPEVNITVYLMNSSEFDSFNSTGTVPITAIELSDGTQASDSGLLNPPYANSWYVVFINDDPDQITVDVDITEDAYQIPTTTSDTSSTTTTTTATTTTTPPPVPPPAPDLLFPGDGGVTANNTPYLAWVIVPGAVSYELQVDVAGTFSPPLITVTLSSTFYHNITSPLADGTYYWRVRAVNSAGSGDWSDLWSFTIALLPAPALSSPGNGETVGDNPPALDWSDITGATEYQVQVAASVSFSTLLVNVTVQSSDYSISSSLATGFYYWRVRTVDLDGDPGDWSGSWSFTVSIPLPAPDLTSPGNGITTADQTPTLDWTDVTGAAKYQVQVAASVSFSTLLVNVTINSSEYSIIPALADGFYYWRVRTVNSVGDPGDWSGSWSFTISLGGSGMIVALLLEVPGQISEAFPGPSADSGYWYAVNLTAGTEYEFELSAGSSTSLDLDAEFAIYDEEGNYLVGDDLYFPANFTFTPEVNKTFYIHIIPVKFASGDTFILKVSITEPVTDTSTSTGVAFTGFDPSIYLWLLSGLIIIPVIKKRQRRMK